ncbi:hypothetical protein EJB05_24879, partial [Eragrostis curvula]
MGHKGKMASAHLLERRARPFNPNDAKDTADLLDMCVKALQDKRCSMREAALMALAGALESLPPLDELDSRCFNIFSLCGICIKEGAEAWRMTMRRRWSPRSTASPPSPFAGAMKEDVERSMKAVWDVIFSPVSRPSKLSGSGASVTKPSSQVLVVAVSTWTFFVTTIVAVTDSDDAKSTQTRCDPGSVYKTARLLSDRAKALVKQLGLGHMLRKLPERLPSRELPAWLMKIAVVEEDIIIFKIASASIILTAADVPLILGIYNKDGTSDELPKPPKLKRAPKKRGKENQSMFKRMLNLLKIAVDNWLSEEDGEEKEEEEEEEEEEDGDVHELQQQEGDQKGKEQDLQQEDGQKDGKKKKVPLTSITVNDKVSRKRKQFTPRIIEILLKHAKDEKLEGKLDDAMAARLFLTVPFNKFLVPRTSNFASSKRPIADDNPFIIPRICRYSFQLIKSLTSDANEVYADIPLIDWNNTCYSNKDKVQEDSGLVDAICDVQEDSGLVNTIGDMQQDIGLLQIEPDQREG